MVFILIWLRTVNRLISTLSSVLGIFLVAVIVCALTASAATRYLTGIGYDWLIELPPMLVPWLVFPQLGPLLKSGSHISVDVAQAYVGEVGRKRLRLFTFVTTFFAACVFVVASLDAVQLFRQLGQVVELEVEFPIWYLYAAFPVGFTILALFALELFLAELLSMPDEGAQKEEVMA